MGWIAGTIVNELLKTLINGNLWRIFKSGDRRDPTHERKQTDAAGNPRGKDTPSRREVYEHYHGQDSWETRWNHIVFAWRLLALIFASCCATVVMHAISPIPRNEVLGYALGMLLLMGLISLISAFIRGIIR